MIKICKECGQEFEATNPRQAYCSREHRRPCPVCGKPVLIKYLSDPTPRCADCRGKKSNPKEINPLRVASEIINKPVASPAKPSPEHPNISTDVRTYVGNPHVNYFIPGHDYALNIHWNDTVYEVTSVRDVTDDADVDIMAVFSSKISIDRNFVKSGV